MIEEMCPLPTPPAQYAPSMHPSEPPAGSGLSAQPPEAQQIIAQQPQQQQFPGGNLAALQLPGAPPPNAPLGGGVVAGQAGSGLSAQPPLQLLPLQQRQGPEGGISAAAQPLGGRSAADGSEAARQQTAQAAVAQQTPSPQPAGSGEVSSQQPAVVLPPIFYCPLTGALMRDPVIDSEGRRSGVPSYL